MASQAPISSWVVAELGSMRLGVAMEMVIGAVPRPAARTPLGRHRGAMCEVITHLGRPVPVLDLALWVDVGERPAGRAPYHYVLVLRQQARLIGVLVDAVDGIVNLDASAVVQLHHDCADEEIFHSVACTGEDDPPLSLLDVQRLMALAAIWVADADLAPPMADAASEHDGLNLGQEWAVIDSAGVRLAVPAVEVGELLAMPALDSLPGSSVLGICQWRARHLPVLDTGVLLDAPPPDARATLLLTFCRGELALGLPVDQVVHLRRFSRPATGQALNANTPNFVIDIVIDDGAPVYLLDTARLMALFPEAAMSRKASPSAAATRRTDPSNAGAFIVFKAGAMLASPIAGLEEVLSAPEQTGSSMNWRGQALPVIDLREDRGACGHLLILRHAQRLAAILVERIESLVTPNTGRLSTIGLPGGRFEMITTGQGADQASYRVLDLGGELSAGLDHRATSPPPDAARAS